MRPGNKNSKEELDSYRSAAADESYAKAMNFWKLET